MNLENVAVNISAVNGSTAFSKDQYFLEGQTIAQFDVLEQAYIFENLQIIGVPGGPWVTLAFSSPSIQVVSESSPYIFTRAYQYYLHVQLRNCTYGETPQNFSLGVTCKKCASGFFSLVKPRSNNELVSCRQCLKAQDGVVGCPGGFVINTTKGYWRENLLTELIYQCEPQFQQFCVGGTGAR